MVRHRLSGPGRAPPPGRVPAQREPNRTQVRTLTEGLPREQLLELLGRDGPEELRRPRETRDPVRNLRERLEVAEPDWERMDGEGASWWTRRSPSPRPARIRSRKTRS